MALLIVNLDKQIGNAQAWRDTFAAQLPELEIRIWPEVGEVADIEYLAFIRPDFDVLPDLPNLAGALLSFFRCVTIRLPPQPWHS